MEYENLGCPTIDEGALAKNIIKNSFWTEQLGTKT
jgi:hypothetical protein